jgi:DNA-binding transcriptional ArsR family regulator
VLSVQILEIATVGSNPQRLTRTLRKIPFTKLVILHERRHRESAEEVLEIGRVLGAEVELTALDSPSFPEVLSTVTFLCTSEGENFDRIVSNASAGDPPLCCAMTVAALANGVETKLVEEEDVHHLPMVAVPYWRLVTGVKSRILAALVDAGGQVDTLSELARNLGVEPSVLHYHLRDPLHRKGLVDMGLVAVERAGNRTAVSILPYGVIAVIRKRAESRDSGSDFPSLAHVSSAHWERMVDLGRTLAHEVPGAGPSNGDV